MKNLFAGIEKEKIERLIKIINQMDSDNDGIKSASLNAADKFLKKEGFSWSEVAQAIDWASNQNQSLSSRSKNKKTENTASQTNEQKNEHNRYRDYSEAIRREDEEKKQKQNQFYQAESEKEYYKKYGATARIINVQNGTNLRRVVLKIDNVFIKSKILSPKDAMFYHANLNKLIKVDVEKNGRSWTIQNPRKT